MSLLDDTFRELGLDRAKLNTAVGRFAAEQVGVSQGAEFLRIRSLPRRRWQDAADLEKLTDLLSQKLKVANPAEPDARLFAVQAASLREFFDDGSVYTVADVGAGKTLLSFLLPVLKPHKRPLLLTYKSLLKKTEREFAKEAKTWKSAERWEFLGYEKLSRSDEFLYSYEPDIIIADEGHALKNPKSGRSKKLARYLAAHPECAFVPLTATPGDQSLNEFAAIMHAALGPVRAPVPPPGSWELVQWAQALDYETLTRRAYGCLALFNDRAVTLDDVRAGVGRRIEESPGVIYHRVSDVACSLYLDAKIHDGPSPVMEHVRATGDELPDGRILETPVEKYQLMSTLGLGFARYIDPPPPADWRAARKLWVAFAGEMMEQDQLRLDTAGAVALACESGRIDSQGVYEAWKAIKSSFKPMSVEEWYDTSALEAIAAWASENDGLVWVPFPALGYKLAELTGRRFFHELGADATGLAIEEYPGTDSVFLSTGANFKGRNLQKWSRNLIIGSGSSSVRLHQQIGRTHRTGQTAEAVEVTFFVSSIEDLEAVYKARGRAAYDKTAGGNRSHKLLLGDWLVPELSEAQRWSGARWRKY